MAEMLNGLATNEREALRMKMHSYQNQHSVRGFFELKDLPVLYGQLYRSEEINRKSGKTFTSVLKYTYVNGHA